MKVSFSPPDITEAEINEVCRVLRSGWITTGPETKTFEKKIAEYVDSRSASCFNSQTAASELVLRLLGVGEGDEVITTAYTYTATASVVCHVGAKLILVDTKKDSPEIDTDQVFRAITEKTKVIIPVDIGGIPSDYDRLFDIVNSKRNIFTPSGEMQSALGRITILADTAHALGAKLNGRMVGSIADFSSFSFHAVKNLTTAEGGALTFGDIGGIPCKEIYKRLGLLSLHGQSKDALEKTRLGSWEYDIVGTWYKCNMTDVSAAMGLAQLKRYPEMLARRKSIIERYDSILRPIGIQTLEHYTDKYESSGHLYITRVPWIDERERNEIIVKMAEKGIAANVHYKPLPMHTAYKNLGYKIKDHPNAYDFYSNEITLPLHTRLTDEMVDYVAKSYAEIVEEYRK